MAVNIEGKVVVITGASSGLGESLALVQLYRALGGGWQQ